SRSKCLPKLETNSLYGANQTYLVNQPAQTANIETIKTNSLKENHQSILNTTATTTYTTIAPINYQEQPDHCYLELTNYPNMIYSDMSKGNVFRVFLPLESEFPAETVSTTRVIGEELNTPLCFGFVTIKNMQLMSSQPTIDRQPDYWMDRTGI
ncbi:hypothetical protein Bhyg_17857, partial [Pseudolycoriella hygida]